MILETRDLVKSFGKLLATNRVSLSIRQGDIHAIIGPNGAGKSTFFNLITGYHFPNSGQVVFQGREITHLSSYRRCRLGITRSFQITSIFPKLTVYDSVLTALLTHGKKNLRFFSPAHKYFRAETWQILEEVGLVGLAHVPGEALSHGDKKRLELAVTLGTQPKLLLLDEPTCGMSPEETEGIMAVIKKLVERKGITVLFTEHDMGVVFGIARRITVLHQGTLIADGDPETVRRSAEVQKVYLGGGQ